VFKHHRFGYGSIQSTIRANDGNKQSAKIHKNGYCHEDIEPFEIGSRGLFVHGVKVIKGNIE
jgi:hypothetical protein